MCAGHRDGQDFRLVCGQACEHEAGRRVAAAAGFSRREAKYGVLFEQAGELAIGPGPMKILLMQQRDCRTVGLRERLQEIVAPARLQEGNTHHVGCLGSTKPACGLASAPRR